MEHELFALADRLQSLRDEKADMERVVDDLSADIKATEEKLAGAMIDSETQNFTRAGRMFSLTVKVRGSAVAGQKDELYDALKQNGFGDLVYETVNANTLSSFVKEQLAGNEDRLPEWLDGLVKVFEQTGVSVRKSTKKN
ncbi:MAG: hypothetical protein FWG11_01310 [Promicromonosporaceae bacterium]|nr:hypothetical protein [Promicromonosporaceae bacterium]